MKYLSIIFILIFSFSIFGQKAQTNQWRGLVLDEAIPEKALEVLGKPKTDKDNEAYRPLKFNEWFDVKEKNFRVLHYEDAQKVEGFKDVKLYFRKGKLVAIWLEPEKLEANSLEMAYDAEFRYLSDKFSESMNPRDFERNQGRSYPKSFPTVYFLMNKNDSTYAFAMITNNSFGSILGKSMGVKDASESLPGKVAIINLISKSLESKAGVNLLK
ncbi:MAG: hypothetical protein ACR2J3_13705 [Aridibacter sp.]